MKRRILILFVLVTIFAANGFSQAKEINITPITKNIFKLWYDRGSYTTNMIVSVGKDGLLLIDTGQEEESELLKEKILEKWGQMPKFIINTHEHSDHTGGNRQFAGSWFIAHKLVRERLKGGSYAFDEVPENTLPSILLENEMSIHFNGEEIKLALITGAHDDNDIVVWFKESNVVCIGDLAYKGRYPSITGNSIGTALKYPEMVDKIVELCPKDAIFIPGHYENMNYDNLLEFKKTTSETIEIVTKEFKKGKTLENMVEEELLKDYEHYTEGYVSTYDWIEAIILGIEDAPRLKLIYDPLYKAYKSGGTEAAFKAYFDIINHHSEEYMILDGFLASIGGQLIKKGEYKDAILFINLEVSEFPDSKYTYINYYVLGNAYKGLNNLEEALKSYKKGLEHKPGNKTLTKLIKELEADL